MTDENAANDFHFSLAGRVRNLGFAPSPLNSLFPLFEAIANALQAIEDRWGGDGSQHGQISIEVLRTDSDDEHPPISGFLVSDNGVGLTAENWTAFRTADTGSKIARGGKGVGRLSWLKVFENTHVISAYALDGVRHVRSFDFGLKDNEPNPVSSHFVSAQTSVDQYGTTVRLDPYEASYRVHCPRQTETIATQIIGHFLKNFVSYEVPAFTVIDRGNRLNLLDFYSENVVSDTTEVLSVIIDDSEEPIPVDIHHILIKKALKLHEKGKHWLGYVGNRRVVREENIDNQLGLGFVGKQSDCVYFGLITSEYLNSHVNQERTRFTFSDQVFNAIHRAAVNSSKIHLAEYILKVREQQARTTLDVIRENPQFLSLTNDVNAFVLEHLSLNTRTDEDIFLELSR